MSEYFKFIEEDVDEESDNESVISDTYEDRTLDNWTVGINRFSEFENIYYTLENNTLINTYKDANEFVNSIISAYNSLRSVTSIRLQADIHNPDDPSDIRYGQNIRFETEDFKDTQELKKILTNHIQNETAPIWHRLETDETSDRTTNKIVKYRRDYFDFCIQKQIKTKYQVTTICGEEEIHPGVFIKSITDHGIPYLKNDCLVQCLNEASNMRYNPMDIRKEIWPEAESVIGRDLHTKRHIKYICMKYNICLKLIDILDQKSLSFNKSGKTRVEFIKVGRTIGILDRVDFSVDKRSTNYDVVYFDLETVGPDQRVYAFTWRDSRGDKTMCHHNFDEIERSITTKVIDCLNDTGTGDTVMAYAWNGSRFDNWIMFKLLKAKFNKKLWVRDIVVNSGNEILSFKLTHNDKHMIFRDPKKLFSVSIPEACKVFGIRHGKHEFNHDEVDEAYVNGTFGDYIVKNRMRIMDYCRQDGILLEELSNCIKDLYAKENINIYHTLTRSVASSICWQKTIEKHKILKDVTLSPYAEVCGGVKYESIMHEAIGGRAQCIKPGIHKDLCGIDVNSMYPYVCATEQYPCGEIVELKNGEDPPEGKLGLYQVEILRQSYPHPIPYRKSKHYAYKWNYDKPFTKWITSVDLEQLDDYKVIKGFYWTEKTNNFFRDFMMDNYKQRLSTQHDDPMNMHLKLKMNGVTGSVFQYAFRELLMIMNKEQLTENIKKYSELVKIIGCEAINDKEYIVTLRPIRLNEGDIRIKAQQEFCKGAISQKPWVLTMFTYSYARKLLRNKWIELEGKGCEVVYCDTDSLYFTNPNKVKISESRELGAWSRECWMDEGAFHSPKVYAVKNKGKVKVKGCGWNSLVIDTPYQNKDLNYEQKMKLFITEGAANGAKNRVSYRHVEALCQGKELVSVNFYMEKSRVKGITKEYIIKRIKA